MGTRGHPALVRSMALRRSWGAGSHGCTNQYECPARVRTFAPHHLQSSIANLKSNIHRGIARLVERQLCKLEVRGSNPLASSLRCVVKESEGCRDCIFMKATSSTCGARNAAAIGLRKSDDGDMQVFARSHLQTSRRNRSMSATDGLVGEWEIVTRNDSPRCEWRTLAVETLHRLLIECVPRSSSVI